MGKTVKGQIVPTSGARSPKAEADVRTGTKTITIHLKDKVKRTRQ